ncbi:hypothetical protein [Sphingomonas sp. UYP23]
MTAIRIAAVSGSLRASSTNPALLDTITSGASDSVTVTLVSRIDRSQVRDGVFS